MPHQEANDPIELGKKLRAVRLERNLSLRELAQKAEVSASLLSQIENGKANPSVRSLHSIAEAVSLPIDYFFPSSGNGKKMAGQTRQIAEGDNTVSVDLTVNELVSSEQVLTEALDDMFDRTTSKGSDPIVRLDERSIIELQGNITWARLTPAQEPGMEFLEITYGVGGSSGAKLSRHSGREFGVVIEGELLIELGFEKYQLKPGDSIIFDSSIPHRLVNTGHVPMQAIWVIFNQFRAS